MKYTINFPEEEIKRLDNILPYLPKKGVVIKCGIYPVVKGKTIDLDGWEFGPCQVAYDVNLVEIAGHSIEELRDIWIYYNPKAVEIFTLKRIN